MKKFDKKMAIESERIKLRELKLSDAEEIYKLLQDKEMVKWTRIPSPYHRKDAINFIKNSKIELKKGSKYTFAIVLKETNKIIGCISLRNVDLKNKNAELGYWLGKNIGDKV